MVTVVFTSQLNGNTDLSLVRKYHQLNVVVLSSVENHSEPTIFLPHPISQILTYFFMMVNVFWGKIHDLKDMSHLTYPKKAMHYLVKNI